MSVGPTVSSSSVSSYGEGPPSMSANVLPACSSTWVFGALCPGDPDRTAHQRWAAMHGYVMLELAGLHLTSRDPVEEVFRPLIIHFLEGLCA